MAKINLNDIQSIYDLTFLNQNAADIESEFQNKVLYRDNPVGEPNQMENDLDMNSNRVLNLPKPTSNSEAARLADVQAGISGNQANLIEYNNSNVQEALDKRTVFVGSVAELEALSLSVGTNVYLTEEGKVGEFVIKAGAHASDPLKGKFINLANSNYAERIGFTEAMASWWGATTGGANSAAVQALLDFCSGKQYPAVINVDSELSAVNIPSDVEVHFKASVTMPAAGSTDCFTITDKSNVVLIGNRKLGYNLTKSGTAKALQISATSDYGNKNIKIQGLEVTGGAGQGVNWYGCDDIEFSDNHFHDFSAAGFQSTSNLASNPYKSRNVRFINNVIRDLAEAGTGNICHGISINSWLFVDDVWVDGSEISNTSNNPIEIWANYAFVTKNNITDGVIPLSFGACHYLHCVDNIVNITNPATSGPGLYGVEAGGVVHYTVRGNIIRGCRNGIRMTGSNVQGGTEWYTGTDLYSESGTLDPANTKKLRILNEDLTGSLSGAYLGVISGNVVEDSLNSGIYVSQDYDFNDPVLIEGNKINRVGRFATPASILAAIYVSDCKAFITGNSVFDSIYYGVYASNALAVLGPNWFDKVDTARVVDHVGLVSGIKTLSRQFVQRSSLVGILAADTPTKGTWQQGDVLYNHAPSAGGSEGTICVTSGTNSAQLNTRTADTTSGSTTVTLSPDVGDAQMGAYITIAGVSGIKEIVDVNSSAGTIEIDVAADATVSGASVTNSSAVFKAFGSIAA